MYAELVNAWDGNRAEKTNSWKEKLDTREKKCNSMKEGKDSTD